MKRFWALFLALSLISSLVGCALQGTNVPEKPPEPGIAEPLPEDPSQSDAPETPAVPQVPEKPSDEPVPEPVFSAVDNTVVDQLGSHTVTITTPTVELPSASAAEVVNRYFALLAGKVRDYAEGDLSMQPGVTCTVTAGHTVTRISSTAISSLWTVETATTSAELPGSTSVSAVTFDPGTGRILTFRDIFGDNADRAKNLFAAQARIVIKQQEANHYYYEDWSQLAATALDESCFYLTDMGVCLFYTRDAIGTYTEVLLTWADLADCLAINP